ncbi:MAG: hypothetical protein KKF24_13395 [Gammaproteobacteria bacterium]|nr:hypothetical protein [Gammaproteobacteria bacterium]MBU1833676.1 hypothetical protein [Gammaproteobacteria bacterium]
MSEITFEFATQDDCLDRMVPSELRQLVAERDQLRQQLASAHESIEARNKELMKIVQEAEKAQPEAGGAVGELRHVKDATFYYEDEYAFTPYKKGLKIGTKLYTADHAGELAKLLAISVCPNTDCIDGAIPHQISDNEWDAEQCQWCDEKTKALNNYRETNK